MKVTLEMNDEEIKELIRDNIKDIISKEMSNPNITKQIRNGTIEYLMKFNLFEFIKLLKQK
jgi:phage-related protein